MNDFAKRKALLIGVGQYGDEELPRLDKTESDVRGVAEVLGNSRIGAFDDVEVSTNDSFAQTQHAIASFFTDARREDLLLLYYAGHGLKDERGRLFLAVNDTDPSLLNATAVSAPFVADCMDTSRSRRIVVILDCCYSGAFDKSAGMRAGSESIGAVEALAGDGYGKFVLTATDSLQYAWEHNPSTEDSEHSVFTRHFIQGLETGKADLDGDGVVTLEEIYDYLYEKIRSEHSRQTPGRSSFQQQGEIRIAFNPKLEGPVVRSAPKACEVGRNDVPPRRDLMAEALRDKEAAMISGAPTEEIDQRILDLRRKQRDGRGLQAGDFLCRSRFKLVNQIGRGGYGVVWKAYDREATGFAAIKVLHHQYRQDAGRRERFLRGARRMKKLRHPGIVEVVESALEDRGRTFYVMEFVGGGNLKQLVQTTDLALHDRLTILLALGETLQFVHDHGDVHRDVKPSNVLLDPHRRPKLTDFDLVKGLDTTGGTGDEEALGTFLYAPPEAMQGAGGATALSDLYSFAMVVVFTVYGRPLRKEIFRNAGAFAMSLDCPYGLKAALAKSLAWEPAERLSCVAELCEEIRRCVDRPIRTSPAPSIEASSRSAGIGWRDKIQSALRRLHFTSALP